ncbi:MAG: rhodanese-like domain-containing protein [Bacteroidetes bacterium]|nr:rhodanese-like domain-containing protein [Bacteroidota bacterium]
METIIIDVRTPKEFSEAALSGAVNIPSNTFNPEAFQVYRNRNICLVCESGSRAKEVMKKLKASGFENVSILHQQMEELRLYSSTGSTWSIDRQFRLALAILVGTFLLGYKLDLMSSFIILFIVFSGLVFSVLTDKCYLKEFIAILPWNRMEKPLNSNLELE